MARRMTKNLGMLLLAIWLIVTGLLQFVSLGIPELGSLILPLLAIVAGVLLLLNK